MAKQNPKNKSDKSIKASVPTEQSSAPRRKRKKPIDFKRYLMIGLVGLAMLSFIFTSLPGSLFSGMSGNKTAASTEEARAAAEAATRAAAPVEPAFTEEGQLSFLQEDGSKIKDIRLEVADDEAQRTKGMMFRKSIPNDTGMLFIFPDTAPRSFWMKNTYVPLDIIFVSEDKTIINIHKNTPTLTEQNFPSTAPAKYVVEVAGGYTTAYGIEAGDKIEFELN